MPITDPALVRMSDLLSSPAHEAAACSIIGCGAIGQSVVRNLAQLRIPTLYLLDPDSISIENCGPQGFPADAIGISKATYLAAVAQRLSPASSIDTSVHRCTAPPSGFSTFVCVDTMNARRHLFLNYLASFIPSTHFSGWPLDTANIDSFDFTAIPFDTIPFRTWARDRFASPDPTQRARFFYFDARMGGNTLRTLYIPAHNEAVFRHALASYAATLYTDALASPESCTTRSTSWCANLAGANLVNLYVQNCLTPDPSLHPLDAVYNFNAADIYTPLTPYPFDLYFSPTPSVPAPSNSHPPLRDPSAFRTRPESDVPLSPDHPLHNAERMHRATPRPDWLTANAITPNNLTEDEIASYERGDDGPTLDDDLPDHPVYFPDDFDDDDDASVDVDPEDFDEHPDVAVDVESPRLLSWTTSPIPAPDPTLTPAERSAIERDYSAGDLR